VASPELADLALATRVCLQRLAKAPCLALGIVSGRTIEDLRQKVAIDDIIYVGNHGLEIKGPGISFIHPVAEETKTFLFSLCEELRKALAHIEGASVDNKGLTLSLHYRLVGEARLEELNKIFYHIINPSLALGKVKVTPSKKAYDIRPAVDWGKGKAVGFLIQKFGREDKLLVIFLGDDVTDYDGFRVVDKNGGISVFVGEESTEIEAQYFLRSPGEVYQFLSMIGESLEPGDG
jgi:trehalose-phosphatase